MKFNTWSRKRIAEGVKHITSRTTIHDKDPDVQNWLEEPLPLWFITTYLYRDEGAKSPEELIRVINQIFRKKVDLNRKFFVHIINHDCKVRIKKEQARLT